MPAALRTFEEIRRPGMEKLLDIARQSYTWYEFFHEKMDLDALPLAYNYMTRSGRLDARVLREKAPRFMTSYDAYLAATPDRAWFYTRESLCYMLIARGASND